VEFGDASEINGEVIGDPEITQMTMYPPDFATTKMYVTPTANAALPWLAPGVTLGQRDSDLNVGLELCINPDNTGGAGQGDCNTNGIFDNDENPISFSKVKEVVCTDASDIEHYMPPGQFASWQNDGYQAWTYLVTTIGNVDGDNDSTDDAHTNEAIIGKLEFALGTTLEGDAVPGTFNNFVWLRDSFTSRGNIGINAIENQTCDTLPGGCL
jgi:hypothetical protein